MAEGHNKIRILLADDHELVRQGLTRIIQESHPDWEVVGEAADGRRALELAEAMRPDVVVLDLSMPEVNGIEVTRRLRESAPGVHVLVLTMHAAAPLLRQLQKAGASALLAKSEAPQQLVSAMERVVAGDPFFYSASASRLVSELGEGEQIPVQYVLMPRELEVLRMLATGMINKEIATELGLSTRTVEAHRASLMERLGVDSLGELVRIAVRDGLI